MKRIIYIGAVFRMIHWSDIWDRDLFCSGEEFNIRSYKMPSIKYSARMLSQQGAVDMYLLIRDELHRKLSLVLLFNLFNYAVPLPEG